MNDKQYLDTTSRLIENATVLEVNRCRGRSLKGTSRFELVTDKGRFKIKPNSLLNYEASSYGPVASYINGEPVTMLSNVDLVLNKRGQVEGIEGLNSIERVKQARRTN